MLKNKIEALLFSAGKKMSVEELAKITHSDIDKVKEALQQLKWDYEQKHSSLMVVEEGNNWKIIVKEEHLPLVKNIITETELSKTLMETLAVIAFKYPIKQSDLIKIRTNKAYDHLKELEEMGYITRQKYGRTKLIRLTLKFFDYFSLPEEKLKEQFKDFHSLAKAIEAKEEEIKKIKEEQKKKAEEMKKEISKQGFESLSNFKKFDKKMEKAGLEVFEETPDQLEQEEAKKVEIVKEKLGELEVVEEPALKESEEEKEILEEPLEEEIPKQKEIFKGSELETKEKEELAETTPEIEKRTEEILHPKEEKISPEVEKKFEELIHPPKEEEEEKLGEEKKESEEETKKKKETEEEPKDLLEAEMKKKKEENQ